VNKNDSVVIIGGGVIGVCAAYFLAQRGRAVTLLEQGAVASGSSSGNAGLIASTHVTPLASPGALRAGWRWLLDPSSHFYIKPRADWDLLRWLWRFRAACTDDHVRRAIPALRDLAALSHTLYEDFAARPGFNFDYQRRGSLSVYRTEAGLAEGAEEARLLREFGLRAEVLDSIAVHAQEPSLGPDVIGGVFMPDDTHLDPAALVQGLAAQCGAHIRTGVTVTGLMAEGGRVTHVCTTQGAVPAGQVVLAAGVWTPGIARTLGMSVPVQAAKGYSLDVPYPTPRPRIPLLLGEAGVAVTPFAGTLRLAGTLELAGLDLSITRRRVEAIRRGAQDYLLGLESMPAEPEAWRGLRPCTPDGLPIIGRAAKYANLIIATGHAMLGMTQGPGTGQLVAQLACAERPALNVSPFRAERFG
jgi:D-amino-acid dehydrogenase